MLRVTAGVVVFMLWSLGALDFTVAALVWLLILLPIALSKPEGGPGDR